MKFNETAILSTPKYLGVLESPKFKDDFQALCELSPKRIALDMSLTVLVTSVGLAALVNCLKASRSIGIELILQSVNPQVMSLLAMTKLNEFFTIDATNSVVPTKNDDQSHQFTELTSIQKKIQQALGTSSFPSAELS